MKKAVVIIGGLATLILLTFCKNNSSQSEGSISPYLNHHDSVKYVGTEKCAQCHMDKVGTFLETGMGKSFNVASPEYSSALFKNITPVYDTFSDLYYYPYWKSGQLYLTEYRLAGKDTIHKRTEKITYIIGSGHHTNSHFTQENGYLFQAPLTFYTQKGKWDLPPGFEAGHNTRFSRKIGMECISCHNSYPANEKNSDNRYREVPHGIGCERCHGPGQIHVEEQLKGKKKNTAENIDYTIVNPKKLTWQRQIDICQRCHLQGNAVLKEGKTFSDFRPGMVLSETFDQFSPEYDGDDKFIMAAHAERFQKSKCFISAIASRAQDGDIQAEFTCISCHNPHVSVKKTNTEQFNTTCKSCHTSEKQNQCTDDKKSIILAGNNCVKCHMPSSGTADIPHVTVHDHYIRKPQENKTGKESKLKGLRCITNKNPDNNTIAEAYISYYEKFDNQPLYLEKAKSYTAKLKSDDVIEIKTIIHLYYMTGDYDAIVNYANKQQKASNDAWTNYRIAKAYENKLQYNKAKNWMNACLELQSDNLDFILQNGILLIKNKEYAQASECFERLNQLYSKQAESWAYLGIISLYKKDISSAQYYFDKALKLDPDSELALENMLSVYRTKGNLDEVIKIEKRLEVIRKRNPQKNGR